jgi:acyl transferase domain-containing protein
LAQFQAVFDEPSSVLKPAREHAMNPTLLHTPIAIVGMACRLPGAANLEAYWRLLCEGRDAIDELPPERLDRKLYFSPQKGVRGKTYSTLGGLVEPRPKAAQPCLWTDELRQAYDPCHRALCDVAADACQSAGYDPLALPWRNAGVYVGHSGGSTLPGDLAFNTLAEETADYLRDVPSLAELDPARQQQLVQRVVERLRKNRPQRLPDGSPYVEAGEAAGLISKMFELTGPHISVDAACASSLVALMLASLALESGQIDMALIGGASFNKQDSLILFSHAQSCSATGSRPFDAAADGLIGSEGYVVMVAKTLERALADGDRIQAVVRGLGYSSDGRGRSLWAPRKEGQLEAVRRAYPADLDPRRVQLIEAHATSTQVGDATEIEALSAFFRPLMEPGRRIAIGSVKSNIGHTLETAGLASLLKVVLAMQHGRIPPTIHLSEPSRAIPWSDIPFVVPTKVQAWPAPTSHEPRLAAVNAFGIGGLNMHVVVEEFVAEPAAARGARRRSTPKPAVRSNLNGRAHESEPIAIIGRGVVLPGALGIEAMRTLLASGRDTKGEPPADRSRNGIELTVDGRRVTRLGGFIRDFFYDWKRHHVPPKQVAEANPLQFMLLDAAEQALRESGYYDRPFDRARTTTVVGTIFGGDFSNQLQVGLRLPEVRQVLKDLLPDFRLPARQIDRIVAEYEALILKLNPAVLDETGSFTSSTLASRIAKTFDLMGGAMAIDSGETSSLAALSIACDLLRSRANSLAICATAQRTMDRTIYESMALGGRLLGTTGSRRTGNQADGFVPGEGVAVLLLKRLADARADGDRVLATIHGIGAASDPTDLAQATTCAAERAWATVRPDRAQLIFAEAGCGVSRFDEAEQRGLCDAGIPSPAQHASDKKSLTQQIGYTRAAHGMVSLIKATLDFDHSASPASTNGHTGAVAQFPAQSNSRGSMLSRTNVHERNGNGRDHHEPQRHAPLAAVSSFAVTGTSALAYHAVIEGVPAAPASSTKLHVGNDADVLSTAASRILRFGGVDANALDARLGAAMNNAAKCYNHPTQFTHEDRFRLAIVAGSASELEQKLRLARDGWQRPEQRTMREEQGIFCFERPAKSPRVVLLFPGQASQYPGMLDGLVDVSPAAAAVLIESDRWFASHGLPNFASLSRISDSELGKDIWSTQAAMLVADLLVHAALCERGVVADCLASHSFGEFPALVAAGAWSLAEALDATRARAEGIAASRGARGAMLSAGTTPAEIHTLIDQYQLEVFVTHHNAPCQTVVGGERDAIQRLSDVLQQHGIDARMLPVPGAFHTPLMRDAQHVLRRRLAGVAWRMPQVTVISGVTNRPIGSPAEIADNLVAQLVEPVRYAELIENLATNDSPVFIEVGPQQVLTRLNRRILTGREAALIGCDHPSRRPGEQLNRVQALLECLGLEMKPRRLNISAISETQRASAVANLPIAYFDATAPRRQRLRNLASTTGHAAHELKPPYASFPTNGNGNGHASGDRGHHVEPALPRDDEDLPAPRANARYDGAHSLPKPANDHQPSKSLEQFLVNFVVEQTGYPQDVVRLDADLEADLGIDSIKQAQLFGELRDYFDFETTDNTSIMKCRTLGEIVQLLSGLPGKGDWLADPATDDAAFDDSPAATPPARNGKHHQSQPADFHDESHRARHEMDRRAELPASNGHRTSGVDDKLSRHLVRFVMEQTGYPADVITLDADLEADLGIDSIKKAQLLGELREQFGADLTAESHVALAEFRTLRQLLDATQLNEDAPYEPSHNGHAASTKARPSSDRAPQPAAVAARTPRVLDEPSPAIWEPPIQVLQGSPAEMGLQQGRELAARIQLCLRSMASAPAGVQAKPGPATKSRLSALRDLPADVLAELQEVARASGVHPNSILAWNEHLTAGVLEVNLDSESTRTSASHLASADSAALTLRLCQPGVDTETLEPIVQVRRPADGFAHVLFSMPGQIGGFAGVNSAGLAVHCSRHPASHAPAARRSVAKGQQSPAMLVGTLLKCAGDIQEAIAQAGTMACVPGWSIYLDQAHDARVRLDFDAKSLKVHRDDHKSRLNGHGAVRRNRFSSDTFGDRLLTDALATAEDHRPENDRPIIARIVLAPSEGQVWIGTSSSPDDLTPLDLGSLLRDDADEFSPSESQGSSAIAPPDDEPAASESAAVTSRFVLRMQASPRRGRSRKQPTWTGNALILGTNSVSKELRRRLDEQGVASEVLPTSNAAAALTALERAWRRGPATHLFVLTPRDPAALVDGSLTAWEPRRDAGVMVPFVVLQRWISLLTEAGRLDEASLVAATSLGGDFGLGGQIASPESGAIAGLLKAIAIELWVQGHRATPIKIIDTPAAESAESVVTSIFRELATPSYDLEIGYHRGRRSLVRAVREPQATARRSTVARGGVWVCTGGARGITAHVARELGRRYGMRLHLLGASPLPQIPQRWRDLSLADQKECQINIMDLARVVGRNPLKEWQRFEKAVEIDQTLRELKAEGIAATYHACDVADRQALARVLAEIRRDDGPIEGILHGAGFGKDARFDRKELENVDKCLRAKVDGAAALMELTRDDPLRYFIGFGSISGRFGANGHTDYSAANDMLSKQVAAFRQQRPECAAATFHWHAWGDIGMATKPETQLALEMIGMQFMPAAEGLEHLLRELEAGLPVAEVLITDDQYYRKFYPTETQDSASPAAKRSARARLPLVEHKSLDNKQVLTAHTRLDPSVDPFLIEHRLDDQPLLPVVVGLELLCEGAASLAEAETIVGLRNVDVLNGVRFRTQCPQDLQTVARRVQPDRIQCELRADFHARDGRLVEAGRVQLRGQVEVASERPPIAQRRLKMERGPWKKVDYAPRGSKFYLGPPLHGLRKIRTGKGVAWGQIIAPLPVELAGSHRHAEGWILPSAALDACLYATGLLAWWQVAPGVALPTGFGSIQLGRSPTPGEECLVETRFCRAESDQAYFNFTLCGDNGDVLLDVADYRIVWLPS